MTTTVNLSGSATDDGLPDPPSALVYTWTKISGPGNVVFADASNPITTAEIDAVGVYVLRLTANDSLLTGFDEVTITIESAIFVPPLPGDSSIYYGDMAAYIYWDDNEIARTWDLQAVPPVWEKIGSTFSGTIYDCQYMHVDEDTVGAWVMTSTGIFFCPDIMAVSPVFNEVLTIASVRATAVAPASGLVIFASMQHTWVLPGHLCVAMSLDTENDDYLHSYYWVTFDYGASWTPVDMTTFTFGVSPTERCYYATGRFSLVAFRSEPILWCARANGRTGTSNGDSGVFKSVDGGLTWTFEHSFGNWNSGTYIGAISHPFPSITDPTYLGRGTGGSSQDGKFYRSNDAWDTVTQLTEPAGHQGTYGQGNHLMRSNQHTFDPDHVMVIFQVDSSSSGDLYESYDQGANWTLLKNLGNSAVTPNGWPPDILQWVLIDNTADPRVQLTMDNFATMLDKQGNLATVLTLGPGLISGGFALPKIAPNV